MSFLFNNPFDDIVEKATSENIPIGSDDIFTNLEIADKIKSKEVPPKEAVRSLKRRINHKNPNVQLLALKLTDTCVKNGGKHFLVEVASRDFLDNLVSLAKAYSGTDQAVRQKVLELLQTWGIAAKGRSELSYLSEVYSMLKREGLPFPPIEAAATSALMETQTAPDWTDSDICMRCRTQFTTFNRKHHCRNCGQTYCHACSSKTLPLPHLGIRQEVRVCDSCHIKLLIKTKPTTPKIAKQSAPAPSNVAQAASSEDAELERAIAASLAESKKTASKPTPKAAPRSATPDDLEEDEDLKAAIEASLKELKISEQRGSAYNGSSGLSSANNPVNPNELSRVEIDNLTLFADLVERMEADVQARGIGVMQHSQISALYAQLYALQPKLNWSVADTTAKFRAAAEQSEKVSAGISLYERMLQERLVAATGAAPYGGSYTRSQSVDFGKPQGPFASAHPTGPYGEAHGPSESYGGSHQAQNISNYAYPSHAPPEDTAYAHPPLPHQHPLQPQPFGAATVEMPAPEASYQGAYPPTSPPLHPQPIAAPPFGMAPKAPVDGQLYGPPNPQQQHPGGPYGDYQPEPTVPNAPGHGQNPLQQMTFPQPAEVGPASTTTHSVAPNAPSLPGGGGYQPMPVHAGSMQRGAVGNVGPMDGGGPQGQQQQQQQQQQQYGYSQPFTHTYPTSASNPMGFAHYDAAPASYAPPTSYSQHPAPAFGQYAQPLAGQATPQQNHNAPPAAQTQSSVQSDLLLIEL
ncbi:vacuolar protein sorting-associated protein 27 [Zopfochytrium polystomum]|nr:vacuolar protein sorting-associated protein 27 [Zopfochytrium polystomum]